LDFLFDVPRESLLVAGRSYSERSRADGGHHRAVSLGAASDVCRVRAVRVRDGAAARLVVRRPWCVVAGSDDVVARGARGARAAGRARRLSRLQDARKISVDPRILVPPRPEEPSWRTAFLPAEPATPPPS